MKRATLVLWGVVLSLFIFVGVSEAADKFGYVDLSRTFSEYNKTKDYDKVLAGKENTYTGERDKKVNEIKQLQDKLNLLSDREKEAKKPDFDGKVKTLEEFDRQKQTDLRKEQDEKMQEILKDIEIAIKQYAEKENYTLVFNDRVLVYQIESLNISDKIIAILNKNYKK